MRYCRNVAMLQFEHGTAFIDYVDKLHVYLLIKSVSELNRS